MGGFYSVILFSLIAERQGLAVKMDDSFLHLSWVFMSVRKSRFWRLHWNLFFYYFRRECCVTSAMLLCLERCICLVSCWQGCYGKGTDRLSPHYQPVARERLSSAHTQTSACEQCSRQWCRSLQEWGLMVFAVRVSLIWLFNPSILHALLQEGCERGKTVSRPAASTLVKWF